MTYAKTLAGVAGAAALSIGAFAGPASAEDREFSYSITMSGTSDYVFRGISLTDEDPAFQPAIEFGYGIFYIGAWGSNIAGDFSPWETDFYAGIRPETGPVSWDFGAIWYTYFGADNADDLDYVELKAGASISPTQQITLGVTGYYTPDQGDAYVETGTVEGTASFSLPNHGIFEPSISGLIGYSTADGDGFFLGEDDYVYWNAGIGVTVEKFFLDFRYWDTDIDDGLSDERFVFSAGVNLP